MRSLTSGLVLLSRRRRNPFVDFFSVRFFASVYEWNRKISALAKTGRINEARQVFDVMPERNVVSWNSMVSGYAKRGEMSKAGQLFDEMPERDVVSWNSMISGYVSCRRLEEAKRVFDRMPMRDFVSWNTMISGYAKNRRMDDALQVFDEMPERDVVSWNAVVSGFLQNGEVSKAIEFFNRMPEKDSTSVNGIVAGLLQNGELDAASGLLFELGNGGFEDEELVHGYNTLIAGYAQRGEVVSARKLFDRIRRIRNTVSWNTMLMCYIKAKDVVSARDLFDEMSNYTVRDNISWNTMISGYVQARNMDQASALFIKMPSPDIPTWNSMISGHSEAGTLELARDLFDRMPRKSLVSWNSMISGHEKNEDHHGAITLFKLMQLEGESFDQHTLSSILSVSSSIANLHLGTQIHQLISKTFVPDITIHNALITMYSKCGAISDARTVFEEVKLAKDAVSWNAMIGGYASHGHASDALRIFEAMKVMKVHPTNITFIAALNACAHAGLLEQGRKIFNSIESDYRMSPSIEHYASLVDIICRHGQLEEALGLVRAMPVEPGKTIWGAILGASRVHYDVKMARIAADELARLEPGSSAPYVLIHNMYADLGLWDEASEVRLVMEKCSVRKEAAHSWVD
ncbi:Pentatricopeptide repeat-containing protein At1g62260, mitochondrial [Linum perenne]